MVDGDLTLCDSSVICAYLEEAYPGVVPDLVGNGLIERRQGRLRLADKGLVLANQVFLRFV